MSKQASNATPAPLAHPRPTGLPRPPCHPLVPTPPVSRSESQTDVCGQGASPDDVCHALVTGQRQAYCTLSPSCALSLSRHISSDTFFQWAILITDWFVKLNLKWMLKDFADTTEVDNAHSCVGVWRWDARTTHGKSGLPVSAGCHECREQTQGRAIAVKWVTRSMRASSLRDSPVNFESNRNFVSKNSY